MGKNPTLHLPLICGVSAPSALSQLKAVVIADSMIHPHFGMWWKLVETQAFWSVDSRSYQRSIKAKVQNILVLWNI